MTDVKHHSCRLVGWNGLRFSCPSSWEGIVRGGHNLLLEDQFTPVAELRWSDNSTASVDSVLARAMRGRGELSVPLATHALPPIFASLPLPGLTGQPLQRGAFKHDKAPRLIVAPGLGHVPPALWAVMDFQLTLPPGFRYQDSSFRAGMSRLVVTDHNLQLQYCRLAPADSRLQGRTLAGLLTQLHNPVSPQEVLSTGEYHQEISSLPPAWRRLSATLTNKPAYSWASIRHDQQHNRLLACTADSKAPIPLETVRHLASSYAFIPPFA